MNTLTEIPEKDFCLFEDERLTFCPFLNLDGVCACTKYNTKLDTTTWGVPYKCSECFDQSKLNNADTFEILNGRNNKSEYINVNDEIMKSQETINTIKNKYSFTENDYESFISAYEYIKAMKGTLK